VTAHPMPVISAFARTPIGGFLGRLSAVKATELGAASVAETVRRSGIDPERIDQVFMGCVLPAGQGQAPARQAALGAGLPQSVQATTVNKMCGSGLEATVLAASTIMSGNASAVIAGGMESMSNAPYLLTRHRSGVRIGHDRLTDSMYVDGLEDAYEPGRLMGSFAEEAARDYQLTREMQDSYAVESLMRARAAQNSGAFGEEIIALRDVTEDEQPGRSDPSRIPRLKPAFASDGTITAANASSISDGAATLLVTSEEMASTLDVPVRARIVASAAHAQEPRHFSTAPAPAVRKVLAKAGWKLADVDLFEINEAFAAVAMIAMRDLDIPHERLNVNGGACALGHPIGASGARILVTLLAALETRRLKRGVASICIGGGEALAMAVERP
jgi:acetyl-CoA C-acetyltransferase